MPPLTNETRHDYDFVRLSTLHYYDCSKLIEIDTATASYALREQPARRHGET
jgi:hypothetical protein